MSTAGNILVVDDEPEIRRLVQEILEDEHYRVTTAETADGAREAFRTQRPDLVLLDIWMPGTDGISLLKEWSAGGRPEVPVVMMSGHGTIETAVEATRIGALDFLEKPIALKKLLSTVARAIREGMPKPPAQPAGVASSRPRRGAERPIAPGQVRADQMFLGKHGDIVRCAAFLPRALTRPKQPLRPKQ